MTTKYECDSISQFQVSSNNFYDKLAQHIFSISNLNTVSFLNWLAQESLSKMQEIDKRILHTINTPLANKNAKSEVTQAESCAFFLSKLNENSRQRHTFIKECVQTQIDFVEKLEAQVEKNKTDTAARNLLTIAGKKVWRSLTVIQGFEIDWDNFCVFIIVTSFWGAATYRKSWQRTNSRRIQKKMWCTFKRKQAIISMRAVCVFLYQSFTFSKLVIDIYLDYIKKKHKNQIPECVSFRIKYQKFLMFTSID